MHNLVTRKAIEELSTHKADNSISIYLSLHAHLHGDHQQDKQNLARLLNEAELKLEETGLDQKAAKKMIKPARRLLKDDKFWRVTKYGVALFVSPEGMEYFHLADPHKELMVVSNRYHVMPLIKEVNNDGLYYVLAMSKESVRLLKSTRNTVKDVTPAHTPQSFKDYLKEREVVSDGSDNNGSRISSAVRGAIDRRSQKKIYLKEYCREIDQSIMPTLRKDNAPLVLFSLSQLGSRFTDSTNYRNVVKKFVKKNPERLSNAAIRDAAWDYVNHMFGFNAESLQSKIAQLKQSQPQRVAHGIYPILKAAHEGRIDTLYVKVDSHVWGQLNTEYHDIDAHTSMKPGDYDLLDVAAKAALQHSGRVVTVNSDQELDGYSSAALLRY